MYGSQDDKITLEISNLLDTAKYAEIYDKYVNSIYRFVYFKVNIEETAEDLTGETFLKTWQYLQNGGKIDNIKAFFYRTASNLVSDYYRTKDDNVVSIDKAEYLPDNRASKIIDRINISSEISIIEQTLKQVNDTYREIIVLYFIEQFSIAEIAEIKSKSEGAIRVLIHRSLKSLKSKLPKDFVEATQKMKQAETNKSITMPLEAGKMPVVIKDIMVK